MSDAAGGLLHISNDGIVGWVRLPERPSEIVKVIIAVNDKPIASAAADRFDLESVRRQVGIGVPGFVMRLPQVPDEPPPFTITVRSAQGQLIGSPLVVASLEELAPAISGYQPATLEGMIERLVSGRIEGWVWDHAKVDEPLTVDILDGSTVLGHAFADQFREDLHRAGKRGGACGFSFELPATLLDMRPHAIHIVVSNTMFELKQSPLEFGPIQLSPLMAELAQLSHDVEVLMKQVGGLLAAGGGLQRDIMRVLAERVDAYSAIQQELIERRLQTLFLDAVPPIAPASRHKAGRKR